MAMNWVQAYFAGMTLSWVAFGIAATVVMVAGLTSVDKKRQWVLVVTELLLFSLVSAMTVPYLHLSCGVYLLLLSAGIIISWQCHKYWWPKKSEVRTLREMWDDFLEMLVYFRDRIDQMPTKPDYREKLYKDLDAGGWINVMFLAVQWAMLFAYLLSPMPTIVVRKVWHLVGLVALIEVIKPTIMQEWEFFNKRNAVLMTSSAIMILAAIGIASWIKLSMP
jgi:hypothetical protein